MFVYISFFVLILIIAILLQFFIIDSNQSEKLISESVGSLGSTHIHFDFKMYIDDELFDLTDNIYIMTNSYAHILDDPPPKRGNIIHTHATNLDLQYFFDTLDIQITSECIITEEKQYCNTDEKKLKTYVKSEGETWILLSSPIGYVIQDLDKILISYGSTSQSNIELQKNKIQLYSKQVFITDEVKDVVPEFLMLLHGVIDSPDIPLNVSRSYLQSDGNVKKINTYINLILYRVFCI